MVQAFVAQRPEAQTSLLKGPLDEDLDQLHGRHPGLRIAGIIAGEESVQVGQATTPEDRIEQTRLLANAVGLRWSQFARHVLFEWFV